MLSRSILAAVAMSLGLALGNAQAQEVKIRFPVEYNADIAPGISNQEFIDLVEERSNGQITVEYFPSGSLYKGLDLLQAVIRGDAEMTTLVSVFWSAVSPRLSVFELPFAFPTREAFYRAADDQEFMREAFSEIEDRGAVVLGILVYDYLPVGNRVRPIRMPEDFNGLKLRALGRTNGRTLELLGGQPVPINVTEVGGALERGVIDGLNTPADAYVSYGWQSIIKHVTDSPHYYAFYPWAVNKGWWESLSEEHRAVIQEVITEVTERHRIRAREEAEKAFQTMREAGVEVHSLTEAEIEAWKAATEVQWQEAEAQFGADLVARLRSYQNAE